MKNLTLFKSIFLLLILAQCTDPAVIPSDGVAGLNALVSIVTEPPSENCESGGAKISVGQDADANGILDSSEVESVSFICNGSAGDSTPLLSLATPESPGENCQAGGTRIAIGLDENASGELDDEEILSTFFVCNGEVGNAGGNGAATLMRVSSEGAGEDCSNGGLKIDLGMDDNENQTLDDEEIASTYFVCNGTDGANGLNTLSLVSSEPSGANCANGGLKVELGLDLNQNGILDNEEIVSENFICNGVDGTDGTDGDNGLSSLLRVTPEGAGGNCTNGGLQIEVGLDDNSNSSLEDDEVEYTYYVCNGLNGSDGTDGFNTLISTSNEPAGVNCKDGGLKIIIGLDTDRDGVIDSAEEIGVYYLCNGSDGIDGSDGQSVILVTAPAGAACANGGTSLTFGYDGNDDGDLSDPEDEILETVTICNGLNGNDGSDGADGFNTIIVTATEAPGANCSNGGLSFQVGLDVNGNNAIDPGEEVGTYYVCNGSDGGTSLISISSFSGVQNGCTSGGLIILTGIDDNENGVLDNPTEVDATSYVCNGDDGSNGASDDVFEFYFSEGFDEYSGVRDASITDKDPAELGETFSVDQLGTDSHGLVYFPAIEKMSETIGTTQYEIVEAILYLRGVSTPVDGATEDNWIGVKNLRENAPLFVENEVSWINANSSDSWTSPGANVTEDQGAFEYSDMFRLPQGFQFNGYIPLLLNRKEIESWTQDPSNNKGLVLTMVDDGSAPYELDIYSSNYVADPNFRPMLYLKAKITSGSGRMGASEPIEDLWRSFSYQEKLLPLTKLLDQH